MKRLYLNKIQEKLKISSRMSRFIRDGAIHLQAKFALANLMRSKKFLGILFFWRGNV